MARWGNRRPPQSDGWGGPPYQQGGYGQPQSPYGQRPPRPHYGGWGRRSNGQSPQGMPGVIYLVLIVIAIGIVYAFTNGIF